MDFRFAEMSNGSTSDISFVPPSSALFVAICLYLLRYKEEEDILELRF
jgi:hypothetical protein